MKSITSTTLFCILLALALNGCSSDPGRTHRADLLDEKVSAQRIQAELARAGADFKDIHVQTRNGVVVLSGTVSSPEIRSRAEDMARSVHGDTPLEDDVQVRK